MFDYNLYKPILDFAREEKVPLVALNIRREIVAKVSKSGLDSLSDEEKKEIPQQMDFSDNEYRDRLMKVFKMHQNSKTGILTSFTNHRYSGTRPWHSP